MNPLSIKIGFVMGSSSDCDVMQHATRALQSLDVGYKARVVSAHRTPDLLFEYARQAAGRGLHCIIAGAGGAARLPGMLITHLPVLGAPVPSRHIKGMDSLLSIVQMPRGIPTATFAIGEAGAANAGFCSRQLCSPSTTRYWLPGWPRFVHRKARRWPQ